MAEPVDWMRRRIEAIDHAFEQTRRGSCWTTAKVCARCHERAVELNYLGRCPFCALTAFLFTTNELLREHWLITGMDR